jgi:hypothetical protein
MSRDFKIKLRSYDAQAGYATFDVPPGSPLAAALAAGVLGHLTVAVEPAQASTAGASYDPGPFRTPPRDARAERDAAVRERDGYVMRLRSVRNMLASVAASNDRLAAQVAMLEAQLAATESQREAAAARVAEFGDMLAAAWPIVRDMFTHVYLRLEPIMRSATAPTKAPGEGHTWDCARIGRAGACAPDCDGFVTRGNQHRDECPNA